MYIDVLFVLNFMMDMIVLLGASRMLGLSIKWGRLLRAALLGALCGCLLTIGVQVYTVAFFQTAVGEALSGIWLCFFMTRIAFGPCTKQMWVRNVLVVYGCSFLLSGLLSWLQAHMSNNHYFITVGISFVLFCAGYFFYTKLQNRAKAICQVNVQMEGGTVHLKGLMDTGNLLTMPVVGTPVTVAWEEALYPGMTPRQREQYSYVKKHLDLPAQTECWQLIPYRSVGCPAGLLPVLTVPYMYIQTEQQEIVIRNGMVGICSHPVSGSGMYEMILNPKLVNNCLKGDE